MALSQILCTLALAAILSSRGKTETCKSGSFARGKRPLLTLSWFSVFRMKRKRICLLIMCLRRLQSGIFFWLKMRLRLGGCG